MNTPGTPALGSESRESLRALLRASDAMMESVLIGDKQQALDTLNQQIQASLNAESCAVFLVCEDDPTKIKLESSFTDQDGHTISPSSQRELVVTCGPQSGYTGCIAKRGNVVRHSRAQMLEDKSWQHSPPNHLRGGVCYSVLAVPLKDRKGNLIGLLKAENKKDENGAVGGDIQFSEADEGMARILANKLVIALENLRTIAVHQDLFKLIQASESYDAILQGILDSLVRYFRVDRGDLILFSEQRGDLVTVATSRLDDDEEGHKGSVAPKPALIRLLWDGKDGIANYGDPVGLANYHPVNPHTRSEVIVRLRLDGRSLGVLNLERFVANGFDKQDEDRLSSLSRTIAAAVHLAAKHRRLAGLLDHGIGTDRPSRDYLQDILHAVKEIYGFDGGIIYIFDRRENTLACSAYLDSSATAVDHRELNYRVDGASMACKVFREGRAYFTSDPQTDPNVDRNNPLARTIHGPVLGIPLLSAEQPIGAMLIWSRQNPAPKETDAAHLLPFASLAAASIATISPQQGKLSQAEAEDARKQHLLTLHAIRNLMEEVPDSLSAARFHRLVFFALEAAGFERARIYEFDKKASEFCCIASHERDLPNALVGVRINTERDAYAHEISTGFDASAREYDPTIPQGLGPDQQAEKLGKPPGLPWAAVPLLLNGQIYGQIAADNKLTRKPITKEHLEYLTLIGAHVSRTLSTSRTLQSYKNVLEDLPVMVTQKDRDGRVTYANGKFRQLCHKTLEELRLMTDKDLYSDDLARNYRAADEKILNGTEARIEQDEEHQPPGAGRMKVHVVKTPVKDAHGAIIGVQVVFWPTVDPDLEELMKRIPDSIYFKNADSTFRLISDSMAERLGLKEPREAVGKSDVDFFANAKDKREDELAVLQSGKPIKKVEPEVSLASKEVRWVSTIKVRLERYGQVIGTCGVSRDITEILNARSELARFEKLLDRANAMIFTLDKHGKFVSLNKMGQRITGYTEAEIRAMNLLDLVAPEFREPMQEVRLREKRTGRKSIYDIAIIAKNRQRIEMEFSLHAIAVKELDEFARVPKKKAVIVGIGRDVTERNHNRVELERLLRNAKEMGRIAWGVNYSLRTRSAALENRLALFRRSLPPQYHDALGPMAEAIQFFNRAGTLPAKLQRLMQAPTARATIPLLDVGSTITGITAMLGDPRITMDLPGDIPRLRIARTDLEDMLVELLMNARDFAPKENGGIRVQAQVEHGSVMIEISDNGPGIHPEIREKLFGMFEHYPPSRMGLGLAYARSLARAYEGDIIEAGQFGVGACFRITLPIPTAVKQ